MTRSKKKAAAAPRDMDYKTYLQLPTLLDAQKPISAAHDEMMFVVVHQTYELWFKLILFELDRVQKIFSGKTVRDADLRTVSASLGRMVATMKLLVSQLDIMETMTPLDFLDFRHVFRSASGFQSLQFRELEIRLGLKQGERVGYDGKSFENYLPDADRKRVHDVSAQASLIDQLDRWLARTPFVQTGKFNFWAAYRKAVMDMIAADRIAVKSNRKMPAQAKQMELGKLDGMTAQFDKLFQPAAADDMQWRLSPQALQAALFINLYRDQPALQAPFKILSDLMDMDELMALWRYRHALMAQRMLGAKMGSGGSTGHDYLAATAARHRIFRDLFALSTFLIPRSRLPKLPRAVEDKMHFRYGGSKDDAA